MRSPLGARGPGASALGCAQGGRLRARPACARVRGAGEAGAPVRPFVPQTRFSRVALSSGSAYPPRSVRFSACARGRDGIAWTGSSTSPGEAGGRSHTPWVSSFRHEVSRRTQLCGQGRAPGGPSVFARPRGGRARRLRRGTRDGERDPGSAGPGAVSARGSRGSGSGAAAASRGQGFGRCRGRAGLKHQIVAERKEMRRKKVDACPKSKGALNSPGVVREAN